MNHDSFWYHLLVCSSPSICIVSPEKQLQELMGSSSAKPKQNEACSLQVDSRAVGQGDVKILFLKEAGI